MKEVWKDIYFIENSIEWDYRGLYQVSNMGRIKSLNYRRSGKEQVMNCYFKDNKNKRPKIDLRKDNEHKKWYVHKLVAHMFCEGYRDGLEVDHYDSNPLNNKAENLRWVTAEENKSNPNSIKKHKDRYRSIKGVDIKTGCIIEVDVLSDLKQCGFSCSDTHIIGYCCGKSKKVVRRKYTTKEGVFIDRTYEYDYSDGIYKGYYWEYTS